jgi:hypothetical protein
MAADITQTEKSAQTVLAPSLSSTMLVGPFLLSTLAVTYDVGFFSGANIGYFTFFSVSEHLVFALQSIPVIAPAFMIIGSWFVGGLAANIRDRKRLQVVLDQIEKAPAEEKAKIAADFNAKIARLIKWRPLIQAVIVATLIFCASAAATSGGYWQAISALGLAAWVQWTDTLRQHFNRLTILSTSVMITAALLLTFLSGLQRATTLINSGEATDIVQTKDTAVPARIVRSGDRGLLIVVAETKKLRFLRWDDIKQIDTK